MLVLINASFNNKIYLDKMFLIAVLSCSDGN